MSHVPCDLGRDLGLGCLLFLQSLTRPVEYRLKGAWILYRELG
jgi:hypothetical protein